MNRAQRRKTAKATPAYKRGMGTEDKIKAFYKNGITVDNLQESYNSGYQNGWRDACGYSMRVCYASAVRALHQLEGYSTKRNVRFLRLMDEILTTTFTRDEAIEAALNEAGVEINFNEPFSDERVNERE